jgi:4-diphosphocytidyl-2-C-methyl-D-erythritol kinase
VKTCRYLSPAKINLSLNIGPKRNDGYHDLVSLFQMIGLYDEIVLEAEEGEGNCLTEGMDHVPAESNLMTKAARLFLVKTGLKKDIRIRVTKNIPEGAGLGGGSGNAGMVLRALRALFLPDLSDIRLADWGRELGSDVPFFCLATAACVTGRGEIIRSVPARTDFFCTVAVPDFGISTAEAYGKLDDSRAGAENSPLPGRQDLIDRYTGTDPAEWTFTNDFQPVLAGRYPLYSEAPDLFRGNGASFSLLSGSGSSCFGLFSSAEKARAAAENLRNFFSETYFSAPLDTIPEIIVE